MLRRTFAEETTYPAHSFASQYIPTPRKDEMSEGHLEDYLDHFCLPLVGRVSYEERVKMREELRSQIESVIAAYVELGSTRAQAIAEALRQFSQVPSAAPVPVAQHTVDQRQAEIQYVEAHTRPKGAFLSFSLFGLATILQIMTAASARGSDASTGLFITIMVASFPLLAGMTLGYRRPDRPLRNIARSLAWLTLPTLAVSTLALSDRYYSGAPAFGLTLGLLFGNLICGGIGAKVGTWMRRSAVLDKIDPPYPARVDHGPYRM